MKHLLLLFAIGFWLPHQFAFPESSAIEKGAVSLVVMDPLAAPLSCPCVEGYAQRRYEVLASYLETRLHRPVQVTFSESLAGALKKTKGKVDLIIGKDSVVRSDSAAADLKVTPLSRLTDLKGQTTQFGMIVVGRDDPAKTVADLNGYSIIFGPQEADEKHAAALHLLKTSGVAIPEKLQIDEACSDGACKVIELGPDAKSAAVISSYAQPLLEGCGTIRKGDLRVVGKTKQVPFITMFATSQLDESDQPVVQSALSAVATEPAVLEALESLVGFLPVTDDSADANAAKKK